MVMEQECQVEEGQLQESQLQEGETYDDMTENQMEMSFLSKSSNEALARMAVAAFITPLNPTIEDLIDVKTAVTEAVTNAIIHGYSETEGTVYLNAWIEQGILSVEVIDEGVGIEDIDKAMEPLYTSKPELERSGMGFSFMSAFMDELVVESTFGAGTRIRMRKIIGIVNRNTEND